MSNVLGTVTPVKEIVRIAHARGIPVLIDGSQGAVHLDVDVVDLDVDFYASPAISSTGRPASARSMARRNGWRKLPPFLGGGEMIKEVTQDRVTYNEPPHRFEAGTPPIMQAIGLGAAINYVRRHRPCDAFMRMKWP